jgi:hypothetical protein
MRIRLPVIAILVLAACAALADGQGKPFVRLSEGSYWEYEVREDGSTTRGRMEVAKVEPNGVFEMDFTGMEAPGSMLNWKMGGEYLVWEIEEGAEWKVLKYGAGKDDTWVSKVSPDEDADDVSITSTVVGVEDVATPAGNYKGCVKVANVPSGAGAKNVVVNMWWAEDVGLVKLVVQEGGKEQTSWTLAACKVGPDISDEQLKEMMEKSDLVAQVIIPEKGVEAGRLKVKLSGLYKGSPGEDARYLDISRPAQAKKLARGDFVVFLKKEGEEFTLLYDPAPATEELADRLLELITPPEQSLEKMKELVARSDIVAGVEIVVLEDRGEFKYYVAKIISAAKGAQGRKHLDVLCQTGVQLEKGSQYILFLENAERSGRALLQVVDVVSGIVEYDEGFLSKLEEMAGSSK